MAEALELIGSTEALRPKPFLARDVLRGFTVAALDERHEMSPLAEPLRRMWLFAPA